jgi:hypothetical protein
MKSKMLLILLFFNTFSYSQTPQIYDVAVYGGTSAGVIAAYTAKMYGKNVILIEPTNHIGGLSSGGLGQTDIGNKYAITGLSRDFYRRIGENYGRFEQWTFEPSIAKKIFMGYINRAKLKVVYNQRIKSAKISNSRIQSIVLEDSKNPKLTRTVQAKMFIDATYEGDLMARAGVSYAVGREANSVYNENWNGVQLLDKHQFPEGIDPYKIEGNSESGLLWGISPEPLAMTGSGDKKLQAYNFRLCLTDSIQNQIPITKPIDYDSTKYDLLLRYIAKKNPNELNWALMHIQPMPHRKTDINNSGPFSTDMIGENYDYANADYETRKKITKKHENYIKGFLYFLGNDPRVPEHLRKEMKKWGYPKDEYNDNQHFSPQMYVREARRMVSDYIMTEHHCEGRETANDGVGMAAYTMDSHNCQRIVIEKDGKKMVMNEGDVQQGLAGLPPYPISYRSIVPKVIECNNLLVPICLSASHIAYGSIRMEPVFMVLGQSAGLAASMAIDNNKKIQEIDIKKLQTELKINPLANKSQAEILVDNSDVNAIKLDGEWQTELKGRGRYGKDYLITESKEDEDKSVFFSPNIPLTKSYKAYIYIPQHPNGTSSLSINIWTTTGKKELKIKIDKEDSDWHLLGTFLMEKGSKNMVEVSTEGANGVVIADAVLFVPVK